MSMVRDFENEKIVRGRMGGRPRNPHISVKLVWDRCIFENPCVLAASRYHTLRRQQGKPPGREWRDTTPRWLRWELLLEEMPPMRQKPARSMPAVAVAQLPTGSNPHKFDQLGLESQLNFCDPLIFTKHPCFDFQSLANQSQMGFRRPVLARKRIPAKHNLGDDTMSTPVLNLRIREPTMLVTVVR